MCESLTGMLRRSTPCRAHQPGPAWACSPSMQMRSCCSWRARSCGLASAQGSQRGQLDLKSPPPPCPAHSFLRSSLPPALHALARWPAATLPATTTSAMGAFLSSALRLAYGAAGAITGIVGGLLDTGADAIAPFCARKGRLQHPAASLLQLHRCRLQRTCSWLQHASTSTQRESVGHAAAACPLRPC